MMATSNYDNPSTPKRQGGTHSYQAVGVHCGGEACYGVNLQNLTAGNQAHLTVTKHQALICCYQIGLEMITQFGYQ